MEKLKNYELRINGHKFHVAESHLNGRSLLNLAGLEPAEDYELLIKIGAKEFEPVQLNETVDLTQAGIETFTASPYKDLIIHVDDEPLHVKDCFLTPNEILAKVEKDPKGFYLKQILDHKEITYKNDPDHLIAIKNHQRFSTCKKEPTTVS